MHVDPKAYGCWFEDTCDVSQEAETRRLALQSIARWVLRDDLSSERRLAAIRRVAHEALSSGA